MGIPVYFKTLISQYQDDILVKHPLDIDILCLDLNCLIHPCCRSIMASETPRDESKMIDTIVLSIETILKYTNLTDILYIAIDGVAPKAKMKQQRERRHKSIYEKKVWDTNSISPGTYFMEKLHHSLREWIQDNNTYHILLSDSNEPGEGEHKIIEYLRHTDTSDRTVSIYGLDADLIMLGIVSGVSDIYLLRERTEYNIEDCDNEYIYLHIDKLKEHILKDISVISKVGDTVILNDYIFLCFLLGNDFINHTVSLSLRYNGLSYILKIYKMLQERYQGYFQLIDMNLTHMIHLTFFKEFLRELSKQETYILETRRGIRNKQYKKIYNQYHEVFEDWKAYHTLQIQDNSNTHQTPSHHISLAHIHSYMDDHPEDKVKDMINALPMFYVQEEQDVIQNSYYEGDINAVCQDYLDSLLWTTYYYFKGCVNWSWCTQYHRGPLLKDLSQYVETLKCLDIKENTQPLAIYDQLSYIFPQQSHSLHGYTIDNTDVTDENNISLDVLFCRYVWECHIFL